MAAQGKEKTVRKLQKSYFDVLGLCCSSEVPLVESILKSLDGVKEITVIVPSRTVIVVHDILLISPLQIVKALNQARLEANVRVRGEDNFRQKWPSPYAIACGVLLLVSLLKFVYHPMRWMALGAVVAGIFPIAWKGVMALKNFRLDINILALIAVIGTVAMSDYFEAATIVFLFSIAEWLESRASHKANAVMSSLMSLTPQKAVLAETGEVVDADQVNINTILAVKAGESIPIDGIVVQGKCEVDEKTLSGESFPVTKQKDSPVWAGTLNINGYVSVKTTALAEDCVVARMAKLVEQAQNSKTKAQRFIDKCAKYYTPAVVLISASLAVIPIVLRVHNLSHWFHFALVVLVSACPCALVLSTPVATFCALTKAAKSGLLIKGGEYLEILAKIKNVAFDKTGTITRGEFVLSNFRTLCDDISLNALIYWVSSIESKSSHPMAAALIDYGRSLHIEPKPDEVEDFQNFPGEGVYGRIDGKDIYIGNAKIAAKAGFESVPIQEGNKDGKTIGYIYARGKPAGIFSLSDACRTGAADAIKELKSLGIKTSMLTGDSQASAMHTQMQLGNALDVVRAELLPEDKSKIIEETKKKGATAMVGDGLNDAPALATADIGISMGISGSALATETGHIVLMSNDIRKVPKAIRLARRAQRKIIENVILSVTTKSAILGLALAGHPLIWAAVLADVGTCLLVICNSMILLQGTGKSRDKCCKSTTVLPAHKHSCNSSNCQSTQNCHQCCSSEKPKQGCKPQKCSSEGCSSICGTDVSNSINHGSPTCSGSDNGKNDHKCHEKRHNDKKCCEADHESIIIHEHLHHSSGEKHTSEFVKKNSAEPSHDQQTDMGHCCEKQHCGVHGVAPPHTIIDIIPEDGKA